LYIREMLRRFQAGEGDRPIARAGGDRLGADLDAAMVTRASQPASTAERSFFESPLEQLPLPSRATTEDAPASA
jgi:hypothetical protein